MRSHLPDFVASALADRSRRHSYGAWNRILRRNKLRDHDELAVVEAIKAEAVKSVSKRFHLAQPRHKNIRHAERFYQFQRLSHASLQAARAPMVADVACSSSNERVRYHNPQSRGFQTFNEGFGG